MTDLTRYREQHQHRLNYMPWLYFKLKEKHAWAREWQAEYQAYLQDMETVTIGKNCFISPLAHIFAEPNRPIVIGDNCFVAADSVLHGAIHLADDVAINHHCILEGGRAGIRIGQQSRLAAYSHIYAFNHRIRTHAPMYQQAVRSEGVTIGQDVWIGAHVGILDGVTIADYAVVGMGSVVTKDVAEYAVVAGNPARFITDRRDAKYQR